MKIGIVSDGKYGDRAFEVIRETFPTEWIRVPPIREPVDGDPELTLPECDLYISFVCHPDLARAIIRKKRPVILGVRFGPGFLRQAKSWNADIVAPVSLCSLEDTTWVPAINAFAKVFGKPSLEAVVRDNRTFGSVRVIRGSPCGSTAAACAELAGKEICPDEIRHFGLRVCHFCRAPRFGKACDMELTALIHVRELIRAIDAASPAAGERIREIADEMDSVLQEKMRECGPVPGIR